jgi:mono/diheme cytochrome c family protein
MRRLLRIVLILSATASATGVEAHAQQGAKLFEAKGNCWTCHGRDGRGTPLAPDLTDGQWLNIDGSLDSIRSIIRVGVARPKKYPAPMPAMGGARLSQAEIDALAHYVLALSDTARPATTAVGAATRDRVGSCGQHAFTVERSHCVVVHSNVADVAAGRCQSARKRAEIRR